MSATLVELHQLNMADVLRVEASYRQLSNAQLRAAGASESDLSKTREALNAGQCFYCDPQLKQPLVAYSAAQESLFLRKAGVSEVSESVVNSLQNRFPVLRDAVDMTPSGPGSRRRDNKPAIVPERNFKGNNIGFGEPTTKLWLSLYFYEDGDQEGETRPVEGVPYKVSKGGHIAGEGLTAANGLVEWETIRPNNIYDLDWGQPGTKEYTRSKMVPLMKKHLIKMDEIEPIHEVLYFVNHASAIVLDKKAHDTVLKEAKDLADKAAALVTQKTNAVGGEHNSDLKQAQQTLRETLARYTKKGSATEAPLDADNPALVEVYSVARSELLLVSIETLDKVHQAQITPRVYYLQEQTRTTSSGGTRTTSTQTASEKKAVSLKQALTTAPLVRDAFQTFRKPEAEGSALDPDKLKQAWEPVKKSIAADWKLGEIKKTGQIPSRLLIKAVAPAWVMHFFDETATDAIDRFIENINQAAQQRWQDYARRREALVKGLETDEDKTTSPDEWAKIQRDIKDIWWTDWQDLPEADVRPAMPENRYQQFAQDMIVDQKRPENKHQQIRVAKRLAEAPLPPVMWDASVGAQIMRYSLGATLKTDFDVLQSGRLGLEASATASANLIEAKAEGNFFLPNSEGHCLKFELPIRTKEGVWEPLTVQGESFKTTSPGPYFGSDQSIVSPKSMFELGESIQGWVNSAQAAQNSFLKSRGKPLKIQVVGHTDAEGSAAHNQKLSERRATAALGLLQNNPKIWLSLFRPRPGDAIVWGNYEVELMVTTVMFIQHWKLALAWNQIDTMDEIRLALKHEKTRSIPGIQLQPELHGVWQDTTGQPPWAISDPSDEAEQFLDADLSAKVSLFQAQASGCFYEEIPFLGQCNLKPDGDWSPDTDNGLETLALLISSYQQMTRKAVEQALSDTISFTHLSFTTNESIGLGESKLLVNTDGPHRSNRRIELIPWAVVQDISRPERKRYSFGEIRLRLSGSVSGEAGANINLAANLNFDVNRDLLVVGGLVAAAAGGEVKVAGKASSELQPANQRSTETTFSGEPASSKGGQKLTQMDAGAGARFAAFAGAKAEGGVKAAIDWRPPRAEEPADNQTGEATDHQATTTAARAKPNKFITLGDVGFTATAIAGLALEGEFKVGFDSVSRRFQIKLKAKLAIGPGAGGSFSFSVALEHMFDFARMVYDKLADNDFHFIDIFEQVDSNGDDFDVYGMFCAWDHEMVQRDHILKAGATWLVGGALHGVFKILEVYEDVLLDWNSAQTEVENLDQLIATIKEKPPRLAYNTPEVKGRLLYRLWRAKADRAGDGIRDHQWMEIKRVFGGDAGRVIDDNRNLDYHHDIEEAAMIVITQGVKTQREWQKTLQFMGTFNKKGEFCTPVIKARTGQHECVDDKMARTLLNQQRVEQELFSDPEDLATLRRHLSTLTADKTIQ